MTDKEFEKVDALLALKASMQSFTPSYRKTQRTPLVTLFESKLESEDYPLLHSLGEMREAHLEIPVTLLSRAEELFGRLQDTTAEISGLPQMKSEDEVLKVVFPVRYLRGGSTSYGKEIPPDLATPFANFVAWWNIGGKKKIYFDESDEQVSAMLGAMEDECVSTQYCEEGSEIWFSVVPGYLPPTGFESSFPTAWFLSEFPWPEEVWVDDVFVAGDYLSGLVASGLGTCTSCRARWGLEPDDDCEDCAGYGTQRYDFDEFVEMTSEDW